MAETTPTWAAWATDVNAGALNNAASNSQQSDYDLATNADDLLEILVDITVGTSTSVKVEVLGGDISAGDIETEPSLSFSVSANAVRRFPIMGMSEARVKVTDNDATDDGSVTIRSRRRQSWTTA